MVNRPPSDLDSGSTTSKLLNDRLNDKPNQEKSGALPASRSSPGNHGLVRRYQIAGFGESAWKIILDTFTGIVHNHRLVDGKEKWVEISLELLPGK